jgi:hypothetical protein
VTANRLADELDRTPEGFFKTRLGSGKGLCSPFPIKLTEEAANDV